MGRMYPVPAPMHISSRLMAALTVHGAGTLHLHAESRDSEGRVTYHYVITDVRDHELESGHDLCSGVGDDVNYPRTMEALLSFLEMAAESYRHRMEHPTMHHEPMRQFGPKVCEWAYMHADELAMARIELEATLSV